MAQREKPPTRDTGGYPESARQRLGAAVERARKSARLSQKAVGGDTVTYKRIRDGLPVRWDTVRRAEEALDWATFAADDILDGAAGPRLATPSEVRGDDDVIVARAYEEAGRIVMGLAGATDDQRRRIAEILAEGRQ